MPNSKSYSEMLHGMRLLGKSGSLKRKEENKSARLRLQELKMCN